MNMEPTFREREESPTLPNGRAFMVPLEGVLERRPSDNQVMFKADSGQYLSINNENPADLARMVGERVKCLASYFSPGNGFALIVKDNAQAA